MAWVTWVTHDNNRPEISFTLPDMGDHSLHPWPYRGASVRNLVCAFSPNRPARVPASLAMVFAGMRRRGALWFTVRLEPGEWDQLCRQSRALLSAKVYSGTADEVERILGRPVDWDDDDRDDPEAAAVYARVSARRARLLKARDFARLISPRHQESIRMAATKRVEVYNANSPLDEDGAPVPVRVYDPLA